MTPRAAATFTAMLVLLLSLPGPEARQSALRVGSVEFFGTAGVDVPAVRARLPIRAGDTIDETRAAEVLQKIRNAVQEVTHRAATDVNVLCCESPGRWTIYVGLTGANYRTSTYRPTPSGSSCLPASAVDVYTRAVDANMKAVEQGDAAEDDSRGYALAHNPALRQIQLEMRQFAVANRGTIITALRDCSVHEHRRAASMLLGYADQSADQIAQLVQSATDADATVRNNALRALEVLASATTPPDINADGLVEMLNSGTWTDRNKAGLLFMRLTARRGPQLLTALSTRALDSLIEMARWRDASHAGAYRYILGRIAGVEETRVQKLVAAGDVEEIIAAAIKRQREARSFGPASATRSGSHTGAAEPRGTALAREKSVQCP